MAELARYYGLDLPIYPEETEVAWNKPQLYMAVDREQPSFIRGVVAEAYHDTVLKDLLKLADNVIDKCTSDIGVIAVPYTWGLYKMPQKEQGSIDDDFSYYTPPGYALVAEVTTVFKPSRLSYNKYNEVALNVLKSWEHARETGEFMLDDLGARQCVNGTTTYNPSNTDYYVDIEPRIYNVHNH